MNLYRDISSVPLNFGFLAVSHYQISRSQTKSYFCTNILMQKCCVLHKIHLQCDVMFSGTAETQVALIDLLSSPIFTFQTTL